MPYKSGRQKRFFRLCKHSPEHARGKCPDAKTLDEYERAEAQKKGVER